jgi:hypothetical protein
MTPKRLGVFLVCILTVGSLIGPAGLSLVDKTSEIACVGVAFAGDPDQYTNGTSKSPGAGPDSTSTATVPPPDGGVRVKPGGLGSLLSVVSVILWGSSAAT